MLVSVNDIKILRRVREECKDVESLMESMKTYGLMNPITITDDYYLVAGFRRLEAAKRLGWNKINAEMIPNVDKITALEIEMEENAERVPFTEADLIAGYERLNKMRKRTWWSSVKNVAKKIFVDSYDTRSVSKEKKQKKNALLSLVAVAGIAGIVLGAILGKNQYISYVLHSILDVISFMAILFGTFYFIRFCTGRK